MADAPGVSGAWRHTSSNMGLARLDLCVALLKTVTRQDRRLLMMYYADGLTFKEIAAVLGLSVSAVSLRHKALIAELRRLAGTTPMT